MDPPTEFNPKPNLNPKPNTKHKPKPNPNPNPNPEPYPKPNPNPDPNCRFTISHKTKYLRSYIYAPSFPRIPVYIRGQTIITKRKIRTYF